MHQVHPWAFWDIQWNPRWRRSTWYGKPNFFPIRDKVKIIFSTMGFLGTGIALKLFVKLCAWYFGWILRFFIFWAILKHFWRFAALACKILILLLRCKYKKVREPWEGQLLYFNNFGGTNILGPRDQNWTPMGPADGQFRGFGTLTSTILIIELWCKYEKVGWPWGEQLLYYNNFGGTNIWALGTKIGPWQDPQMVNLEVLVLWHLRYWL